MYSNVYCRRCVVLKPRIKSILARLARAAPLLIAAALAFGPMSGCYARVRPSGYYGGGGYYRGPDRYNYPRARHRYYRAPDPYYRGHGRHHHHHDRHHHRHHRW
jgi:hypothetical protein